MNTGTHRATVAEASPAFATLPGTVGFGSAPDHGEHTYRGSNLLAGRVALVTGGDRGTGRAAAIAFAREGADILIGCSEHERPLAEQTCRWVWQAGRRGVVIAGDLQSERHCAQLVEAAVGTLGKLDVLVNSAVVGADCTGVARGRGTGDATWKASLYPMFWLCRAAMPCMAAGGVIINAATVDASVPGGNLAAHATTRAAVVNFTRALSPLALRSGIRVNAVTTCPVATPSVPLSMAARPGACVLRPQGVREPADLAPLYVYLASDAARVVPGEVYGPSGDVMRA